jgi:hypothetical protein
LLAICLLAFVLRYLWNDSIHGSTKKFNKIKWLTSLLGNCEPSLLLRNVHVTVGGGLPGEKHNEFRPLMAASCGQILHNKPPAIA